MKKILALASKTIPYLRSLLGI